MFSLRKVQWSNCAGFLRYCRLEVGNAIQQRGVVSPQSLCFLCAELV
jgi:hypothetical protein